MRVVTLNVNGIRAAERKGLFVWLSGHGADVVCLQELKCTEEQFPFAAVEAAGYHAAVHGQKTYNGVAILAKSPVEDVTTGFGDGGDESQARVISGTVDGARIISVSNFSNSVFAIRNRPVNDAPPAAGSRNPVKEIPENAVSITGSAGSNPTTTSTPPA